MAAIDPLGATSRSGWVIAALVLAACRAGGEARREGWSAAEGLSGRAPRLEASAAQNEAYVALRIAMLTHDFARADLPGAVQAFTASMAYGLRIPPPSSADAAPSRVRVVLEPSGTLRIHVGDEELSANGLAELEAKLPAPGEGEDGIELVAGAGIDFQTIVAVQDVVRRVGYGQVRFGVRR